MGEVKRYTQFMLGLNRMMTVVNDDDYTALEREVERLRKVEVAAIQLLEDESDAGYVYADNLVALAEACGRKG